MNSVSDKVLNKANQEAILNLYSYVSSKVSVEDGTDFETIVSRLGSIKNLSADDADIVAKLQAAVSSNETLKSMRIGNQISEPNGMSACTFTDIDGNVSVVFKGTGNGEWKTNGDALSGIPETNTYYTYDKNGNVISEEIKKNDYACDQQVKALNWFNKIASENSWDENTNITVSGHSAGGNKAQFITVNSPLVDSCYSFDGQGYSPEAIKMFKEELGEDYEERLKKMYGFSAYNDYVNVLGEGIIPDENICLLRSPQGDENVMAYHFMQSIIDGNGRLNDYHDGYGQISEYISNLSDELMDITPELRRYATAGVMKVCQDTLGKGADSVGGNVVGEDGVAIKETTSYESASGLMIAMGIAASQLLNTKDGGEALWELVKIYGEDIAEFYNGIGEKYDRETEAGAILASIAIIAVAVPVVKAASAAIQFSVWATETVNNCAKAIEKINAEIYRSVSGFVNIVVGGLIQYTNKNFNTGYSYSAEASTIEVDTAKLRNYSERLLDVNRRLSKLDERLNSLYHKVGLLDLWSLISADALTCESRRLANCAKYLTETASDFEKVERDVTSLF